MSPASEDPRAGLRRQFELLASSPAALSQLIGGFREMLALRQQEAVSAAQSALYDAALRPHACQVDGMREQLVEIIRMMESCQKQA